VLASGLPSVKFPLAQTSSYATDSDGSLKNQLTSPLENICFARKDACNNHRET